MVFRTISSGDALSNVASSLLLSPASFFLRTHILARQRAVIAPLWPQSPVISVGSFPAGLALNGSDLDVVISLPQGTTPRTITWAQRLHHANIFAGLAANKPPILVGRLSPAPVLKYVVPAADDAGEEVPVDVSFQTVQSMIARNDFITLQLAARPGAKEALVLLKAWIKAASFDQPLYGGIGSYGLTLSVIAFLNRYELAGNKLPKTPWGVVTEYLRHYTHPDLEMFRGLVDVKTGKVMHPGEIGESLLLADPVLWGHVVGAKSVRMMEMVEAMRRLLERLESAGPAITEDEALNLFTTVETPVVKTEQEMEAQRMAASKAGNRMRRIMEGEKKVGLATKVAGAVPRREDPPREADAPAKGDALKTEAEKAAGAPSKEADATAKDDAPKTEVDKVVAMVMEKVVGRVAEAVGALKGEVTGVVEDILKAEKVSLEEKVEETPEAKAEESKESDEVVDVPPEAQVEDLPKEAEENR